MTQLYRECGFEIHRDDVVTLVDRRTWGLGYGMGILALVAALVGVVGVLGLAGAAELRSGVPATALLAAAIGCGLASAAMLPAYRRRRDVPLEEVSDAVIVDPASGALRERAGDVLSRLDAVSVAVRIDWLTRGWMRVVVLTWPGGRRVVYRTASRARARIVADLLGDTLRS